MGICQSLEANLVVGGLCSLPYFLFRLASFPCLLPVDFEFAFLAYKLLKLAFCLSKKKKNDPTYFGYGRILGL